MKRTLTLTASIVSLVLAAHAHAGDPPAHTAAMLQAAELVIVDGHFEKGVGAPEKDGVVQDGMFRIDAAGNQECEYPRKDQYFPDGCSYETLLGKAVNEPDAWQCRDGEQPKKMSSANTYLAPGQAFLADKLAYGSHERAANAAMVCNWNRFAANPALFMFRNNNTASAHELVMEMADDILSSLRKSGATEDYACDQDTWREYQRRVANALHYTQDEACEHHDEGNMVCNQNGIVPTWGLNPIIDLPQRAACTEWLATTLYKSVGDEPPYFCDEAVVAKTDPEAPWDGVELNGQMKLVVGLCPNLSLACVGLERTLRHHCYLETDKRPIGNRLRLHLGEVEAA